MLYFNIYFSISKHDGLSIASVPLVGESAVLNVYTASLLGNDSSALPLSGELQFFACQDDWFVAFALSRGDAKFLAWRCESS
jgi:hypothetical protein